MNDVSDPPPPSPPSSPSPSPEQPEAATAAIEPRASWSRAAEIVGWLALGPAAWVTISRALSIQRPLRVTVLLQALTPFVYLVVWPIAALAAWRRRWLLGGVAAAFALVHVAAVWPAVGVRDQPRWAATASALTLLESNAYVGNADPKAAARTLLAAHADVMVIVEAPFGLDDALRAQGVDATYPYRNRELADRYTGEIIYSRFALTDGGRAQLGRKKQAPVVTVDVNGTPLRLAAVHLKEPLALGSEWADELRDLATLASADKGPTVLTGDFNGTRWQPAFGDALLPHLHDADEAVGRGLSFSWPIGHHLPVPIMRLDHTLVNEGVAVLAVHDLDVPGSDHRGEIVELAIKPRGA